YHITEKKENSWFSIVHDQESGSYNRYFHTPVNMEDLQLRKQLIREGSRLAFGFPPFGKEGGSDGLHALSIVTRYLDDDYNTNYSQKVRDWKSYLQANDLSVAIAMSDTKGNRALRPNEQVDRDQYVHIEQELEDGIIICGAKAHITTGPYTNEFLILPTRNMSKNESNYAVSCAVKADQPGIKILSRTTLGQKRNSLDFPVSSQYDIIESMVIFDRVFVPWDRVFMAGEYEYSGMVSSMFANYHRFTASVYKYSLAELLVGAAHLIAEYHGLLKVGHIRDKLATLVLYTET